jgi:hypothetical protein
MMKGAEWYQKWWDHGKRLGEKRKEGSVKRERERENE